MTAYRMRMDFGVAYINSLTPFIEAIENAAMSSATKQDAERAADCLESAAIHIRDAIYSGHFKAEGRDQ